MLSVTLAPTQTRPTTSGRIETLNNTSNIKKSQPGSKIHKNSEQKQTLNNTSNIKKSQPGLKILRPESTINIHVHVHNHNQISEQIQMSHIMCNVKFFQPGSKILRTESDNQQYMQYQKIPARIRNS
jgi:hypothetical protein